MLGLVRRLPHRLGVIPGRLERLDHAVADLGRAFHMPRINPSIEGKLYDLGAFTPLIHQHFNSPPGNCGFRSEPQNDTYIILFPIAQKKFNLHKIYE